MLVLDGEKKLHVELVQHIDEDAAATSARLHMQRHIDKTTLQNKGVRGIVGLVIKSSRIMPANFAYIAQKVERLTCNEEVVSSNLTVGSSFSRSFLAGNPEEGF